MSKVIEYTYQLYNNPFVLTQLLLSFYKNYQRKENDILLAYLILPLVLYPQSRDSIVNANIRSSILKISENKNCISGLANRVAEYKQITNLCIQQAIDNKLIELRNMSVVVINNVCNTDPELNKSIKAASNLVKVFGSLDVVTIYRLLGIKEL